MMFAEKREMLNIFQNSIYTKNDAASTHECTSYFKDF